MAMSLKTGNGLKILLLGSKQGIDPRWLRFQVKFCKPRCRVNMESSARRLGDHLQAGGRHHLGKGGFGVPPKLQVSVRDGAL